VVAVSTDPARDSALPHPSALDQPASYRDPIVRRLLSLVRLKLSSIPIEYRWPGDANAYWKTSTLCERLRCSRGRSDSRASAKLRHVRHAAGLAGLLCHGRFSDELHLLGTLLTRQHRHVFAGCSVVDVPAQ